MLPPLDFNAPASAYRLQVTPERPVIYTRDTVVNRLVMIARDGHGCWRTAFTGRAWPFDQRWVMSPFPNMHLPPGASPQEVTILLQDGKSIRPWLHSASEDDFICFSPPLAAGQVSEWLG